MNIHYLRMIVELVKQVIQLNATDRAGLTHAVRGQAPKKTKMWDKPTTLISLERQVSLQCLVMAMLLIPCSHAFSQSSRWQAGLNFGIGSANWKMPSAIYENLTNGTFRLAEDGAYRGMTEVTSIQMSIKYNIKNWLIGPSVSYVDFNGDKLLSFDKGTNPVGIPIARSEMYLAGLQLNYLLRLKNDLQISPKGEIGLPVFKGWDMKRYYSFGIDFRKEIGKLVPFVGIDFEKIRYDYPVHYYVQNNVQTRSEFGVRARSLEYGIGCLYKF